MTWGDGLKAMRVRSNCHSAKRHACFSILFLKTGGQMLKRVQHDVEGVFSKVRDDVGRGAGMQEGPG